jgi:lipopolysaccharide/colanic/teichoic acid biosynthesis glycosyltransferase
MVLSPLMAMVAVAIKLDSEGPALFRQARLGRHGRVFRIVKFRTMRVNAGVEVDVDGQVVTQPDDSRHTNVGRALRQLSLDEMPQLINVLVGDMSLVGPRPDLPEALGYYSERDRRKLDVKPGLTGLAQVSGRNLLHPSAKWALDVEYAETCSLWLDCQIAAKTVGYILARKGIFRENPQR